VTGDKAREASDMAAYKNINGVAPTMLRQDDFYNYPNKVTANTNCGPAMTAHGALDPTNKKF
jgi:hypothetical protein